MIRPKSVRQQGWGEITLPADFPEIVCLCGSTRFVNEFNLHRERLTREGKIVLAIEIVTTQTKEQDPQHANPELKKALDELHLKKIDLSDRIFVINVKGYVGESTALEIAHATRQHRKIEWLHDGMDEESTFRVHRAIYGELKK